MKIYIVFAVTTDCDCCSTKEIVGVYLDPKEASKEARKKEYDGGDCSGKYADVEEHEVIT